MALFGLAAMHASGCVQPNASHCANLDGDATCVERGGTAAVCSKCTSVNDGCVGTVTVECAVGGGGTSEVDTTSSDVTVGTTLTDGTSSSSQGMTSVLPGTDDSTTEMMPDIPVAMCGDGMVNTENEDCDGEELSVADCAALDYDEGELSCTDECVFDLSDCSGGQPPCGNGMLDPGEQCDTKEFGPATCQSELESEDYGGSLFCNPGTCEISDATCCLVQGAECVTILEAPYDCCPGLTCQLDLAGGLSSCKPPP